MKLLLTNGKSILICYAFFPTGQYGEHQFRQGYPAQNLSFSEYIKSRILNKDSRFCTND
uniref:Uncharacterized protein n=1 Tax=Amphimedon queenslandica TaxID=400682 RepID=A0A1X7V575_AMPQE